MKAYWKELVEQAVEEYRKGTTSRVVAEKFGVSQAAVCNWVRRAGITRDASQSRKHLFITIEQVQKDIPQAIAVKRVYQGKGNDCKIMVLTSCPDNKLTCKYPKPKWRLRTSKLRITKGRCGSCGLNRGGGINLQGYRVITTSRGKTLEHRWVMEKVLGRRLRKGETVHHKNGKRADNRELNLELRMAGRHPKGWSLRQMREYLKTIPRRLGGLK